ncbi:DNA repair protein XRCC1-like isoform X2 [Babylonia areolata]|uniref:DNA repair protein XRCC1-like isoform X2 n=1 Tax=Babylonia areolata TaxID=304850 RepID=UPI003FD6223C
MPEIQLKHVVSCSSEDRNNPADNLLKAEGTHKWRTAVAGEKNATVVLQFEKACQITGIDIGNEGSAFVEILVGKSTSSDSDYQVLLVSSSFMGPTDSRSGNNRNTVRMFTADKLSKAVASEKWDRVKIVCTQPFNKSSAYGLSFIKFHTGSDSSKPSPKEGMKKLGAFFVKKDDDEEDDIKVGTLFANKGKKETTTTPPSLTGAAAVRAASRLAEETHALSSSRPSTSRLAQGNSASANAKPSPAAATTARPSAPPAAKPSSKKHGVSDEGSDTEEEEAPPPRTPLKRQSSSLSSVTSTRSGDAPPPLKRTKTEPPKPSPARAFSQLMEKVTFVLSGFQNPYRGELREKALEMGAVYKPDWGKGCTHLICAFTNTPKYNQVNGRGRIVSKQWINDCYKQKKLLPWRKYRLGNAESPGDSSEEEEITVSKKTTAPKRVPSSTSAASSSLSSSAKVERYGGDTDSADDTDEEIRRATEKARVKKEAAKQPEVKGKPEVKGRTEVKVKPEPKVTKPDPALELFADSTDEDEPSRNSAVAMDTNDDDGDSGLPDLPDFFADKHFFFFGDFDGAEKRLLTRYIAAYDGVLEDYMTDRVKYVITSTSWDDNFEEALTENPALVFVKPQWIHSCHSKSRLTPYQPFIVVP